MSASMTSAAVPRTILAFGIVFELFGIFISLLSPNPGNSALPPTVIYIVQGTLIFPIIVGVLELTTTHRLHVRLWYHRLPFVPPVLSPSNFRSHPSYA